MEKKFRLTGGKSSAYLNIHVCSYFVQYLQGRALYNVLLDIVSRLSDAEVGVSEEQFRVICTELFSHMNNDKQSESLMERFVLRFRATS